MLFNAKKAIIQSISIAFCDKITHPDINLSRSHLFAMRVRYFYEICFFNHRIYQHIKVYLHQ